MPNIENLTQYAVVDTPSLDKSGRGLLVVCVSGRFAMPKTGLTTSEVPQPTQEQPPPIMEAEYYGDPGSSSLKFEGQSAYYRPGTDIYMTADAWAPRGQAAKRVLVDLRVGPCQKQILVTGDRVWRKGILEAQISKPKPFVSMPLVYERAFGGVADRNDKTRKPLWEPRNPVGCGLYRNAKEAEDKPLPNLEDPHKRISSIQDRPQPVGVGPISPNWQPRIGYAGTYDETWVQERAPLWPHDFDERFFCAASPGLTSKEHLAGGEPVTLIGVSPDGPTNFCLPTVRLLVKARFRKYEKRCLMTLDALHFTPDEGLFTLIWRGAIPAHRTLPDHEVTIVRELELWEDPPR